MKKLKPTAEERQLGLDPNKYTKKKWSPLDYQRSNNLGKIVDEMRQPDYMDNKIEGLEEDQSMSPEEIQSILKSEDQDKQEKLMRYLENKPTRPLPRKPLWK